MAELGGGHLIDLFGEFLLGPVAHAGEKARGRALDQVLGAGNRRRIGYSRCIPTQRPGMGVMLNPYGGP